MERNGHEHVVLDELVFHAYQNLANVAEQMVAGGWHNAALGAAMRNLREALEKSRAMTEASPYHHIGVENVQQLADMWLSRRPEGY